MSVIPFAKIAELRAQTDPPDETERLLSALGRYTSGELLELLYVGEEPGFFDLMRLIFGLSDPDRLRVTEAINQFSQQRELWKQAIEGHPIQPVAEAYARLKDLRRRGSFSQFDVLQSEALQPEITEEFRAIYGALTQSQNASIKSPETAEKVLGSLIRFLEIRTLANRVFGDESKAEAWLNRPNTSFSGQRPIDLLHDELGTAVVREALEQIDHGIFS